MHYHKNQAVILGLSDTGVAVARCLGRVGIKVEGYDYDVSDRFGFQTKYCQSSLCPDPEKYSQELLDFLFSKSDGSTPKILYPCADEYVIFISLFREQLKDRYRFLLPDRWIVEKIINKAHQHLLIQELDISLPQTIHIESIEQIQNIADELKYPILIKPIYRHKWEKLFSTKGIKINNKYELLLHCDKILAYEIEFVVQEIIPGNCTNNIEFSTYIDSRGKFIGSVTIQKIRQYPQNFGCASMVMTIKNEIIEAISHKILEKLEWRGFANIEFKYDRRDGKYKFIEINPRVWLQIELSEKFGINFPILYYNDMLNIKNPVIEEYPEGIKWMDIKYDIVSGLQMILRKELTVRQWIASLKEIRSFGLFALDDLRPFFSSIRYGASILKIPKFVWKIFVKNNV